MLDAAWNAQERIAKGDLSKPLPENPTPEQLAEFRKAHGIPEKADDYWNVLPKFEEADKGLIAPWLPLMHELNLSPQQAGKLGTFRQQLMEQWVDQRNTADQTLRTATEDELRQEWGGQYRAHVNGIEGFLRANFGEDGMEAIKNARAPNGDRIFDNPGIRRALAQLVVSTGGGNVTIVGADGKLMDAAGVEDRIAQIEKMMRDDNANYIKNEKVQAEYRALIDKRSQNRARAA